MSTEPSDSLVVRGMAFYGYRSFGPSVQIVEPLTKLNVFIGKNNCGKSNILRFVKLHQRVTRNRKAVKLTQFEKYRPGDGRIGIGYFVEKERLVNITVPEKYRRKVRIFLDSWPNATEKSVLLWVETDAQGEISIPLSFVKQLSQSENLEALRGIGTGLGVNHPDLERLTIGILQKLLEPSGMRTATCRTISAIRKVGEVQEREDPDLQSLKEFSGDGIIERLFKIQNPNIDEEDFRREYSEFRTFVRDIFDDSEADIRVSHDKSQIKVLWNDRELPLEWLGTGIHELIIMAAACTVFKNQILLIEEPELHLHPDLQRKLIRYLAEKTSNQYFITTHSAHIIDDPNVSVFHVWQDHEKPQSSHVRHINSRVLRSEVCRDLGYRASDIVQANAVIWVEGPSDRVYIRHWLKRFHGLEEGLHYETMFYGGSVVSHVSTLDRDDPTIGELVSLVEMNRHSVIYFDSDRRSSRSKLKAAVQRIQREVGKASERLWVSEGREIENYVPYPLLAEAIFQVHPKSSLLPEPNDKRWSSLTHVKGPSKKDPSSIDKMAVSRKVLELIENGVGEWDGSWLKLEAQVARVARVIHKANDITPPRPQPWPRNQSSS